jgi:hypothetical protein
LILFTLEIILASIVIDEYKYSFFFYLDIIATVSIINDVPWLMNQLNLLVGLQSMYISDDAIAGVMYT